MKHTNHPKKAIRMAFALILSLSMILSLAMTTAIAADSDAANENLKALGRHLAGIEEIADAKKLDAANLTGDDAVNSQSLVRWARALLRSDKSPDLTIKKEKTVTGGTYHDVTIDAAVGDGTVTLDGVTITGELIVQGGGSNSIKVKNCEVKSVVLDKDTSNGSEAPRLELTGTTVETVEVAKPAIIESNSASGEAAIGEVKAAANVTVQGAATNVGKVTVANVPDHAVANGVRLTVHDAKVKEVKAEAPVTIETNATASKIENVEAKDDVTVVGSTKIDTITVPETVTTKPEITVSAGSVNTVEAKSEAKVSGAENAIANVEAAAPVEVSSTAVAQVTVVNVTVNVTVTVNGSGQIEVKVDTTSDVEIKATSTNNLSVSTTQTVTNNITVKQGGVTQTVHIHKWAETGRVNATCTETGSITYTCNEPDCTAADHSRTETIPAKGHVEVVIPAVEPTCTAAGSTAGKKCDVCDTEIVKPQPVNALAEHTYGEWIAEVTADGTTDGVKGHYHCAVCGKNFDAQKTELTDLRIPAPIAVVTTEDAFCAALKDTSRIGVKVSGNITLSADTTISADKTVEITAGKTVEIASGKTLTLQGSLRVYGTLTNHGTISGSTVDAFGGTVVNDGTIQIGAGCMLAVEKGSTLTNTGNIFGGEGSEINIGDYINTNVTLINTVTGIDNNEAVTVPVMKAAAVFDSTKLQDALDEYDYVVPCGTNTAETNTVTLGDLTVPKGKLLILKETVDAGTDQYHNSFALNGDLTVAAGGTLVIRGSALTAASDANLTVAADGMLVSREGGSLTVASGAELTANGYVALETLTVNGHVYTEEGGLDVTTALTVNAGGTLEVGSGSSLNYSGENNATINGTIIKTIRYVNGFEKSVTSTIKGNGVTSNKTLTTLVFDDDVVLTGKHTVDTVVAYEGTLRVAPGGSLKYKNVYRGNEFTGLLLGNLTTEKDENGYYTLTAAVKTVTNYADFAAALENESVTYITVDADITVPSGNERTRLDITKPVVIADDCTFTVAHYAGNNTKSQLIMNEVVIKDGGSLTLGKGATLTATEKRSGNNEMFYRYFGRVYVDYGGVLDVSHGNVTDGSAIYYNYGEENSNRIIVGENNIPDNIAFEVHNEEQLRGAMADPKCTGGIEADMDITLTEDLTVTKFLLINDNRLLTVSEGVTLTVPAEKELQVSGQLYVYGKVVNHGTIYGFDIIDVIGGTLENDGAIEGMMTLDEQGEEECISLLVVENGGVLNNYTTDTASTKSGTIHDAINFVDYWYTGAPTKFTTWNVLAGDTTLNGMGQNIDVVAVAFGPEQVKAALDKTVTWGNETETHSATKYTVVMASGTALENGTVTLDGLSVNPYQTLLLKERVNVGDTTYRNATYNLSNITFGAGAGLVIKGAPTVNITGTLHYNYLIANEGAVINGNGYVHSAEQLKAALQNGGDIYLYPYDRKDIEPVIFEYEDGHTETVYETQYRIASDEPYAISKDTNLISLGGGDPMAVFFDGGFTVANGTTLKFNGLNVVAAKDSSVGGRVEVCNGILVVQANSQNGAELTIENNGVVQVGNPDCDGKLAIFPKEYENNKIVNNGTIERFGDIVEWEALLESEQFTGNEPVEFINYVGFGDMLRHTIDNRPGDVSDEEIESYRKQGREWPDDNWGSENFAYLVKYGSVQPREDGCWPAWKCLRYSEAKTILVNVWKAICGNESALPDVVKLDIDNGSCLNRQQAEQLVNLFAAALRAQEDGGVVVTNDDQLTAALQNGGDIYLYPFAENDKAQVEMDGQLSYETQYSIEANTTISKYTNLISLGGGDPMAVFFNGGFTVAPNTTLRFDGLNVVAAADSTVKGRVEVCNGILVVQANSEAGAKLTIEENGVVQVGNPDCDGKLAIFPKLGENGEPMFENAEQIVNNGAIERFGDIISWSWDEKTDNQPLEFVNYRNLVCDLQREFGDMPNLVQINPNNVDGEGHVIDLAGLYAYPDGGQFYNENDPDKSDFDAIGAFGMLINSGVIPEYNAQTSPRLNPWHYVTKAEVKELFTDFANKVLESESVTLEIPNNNDLLCCTDNILVEDGDNSWYTSEYNLCFNALRKALRPLTARNVTTEDDFLDALDASHVTEIHITKNITLDGRYYKDGQRVASADETDDKQLAVYLWAAGQDGNQWREIVVDPGFTLTVAQGVKMDIQRNVELLVAYDDKNTPDGDDDAWGNLTVKSNIENNLRGNINVFGWLEPDENDRSRITLEDGAWISYFGDAYYFGSQLRRLAGDYMTADVDQDLLKQYEKMDGWDGGNPDFTCLVAYGLTPESNGKNAWWMPWEPLHYGQMRTILTNVYRDIVRDSTAELPDSVAVGDENWQPGEHDILDNRNVDELLNAFANVLPQQNDNTTEFAIRRHDGSNDHTDGMTVVGKNFTQPVTVTCDTQYLNGDDDWGGELKFHNCTFTKGVTVQAVDGVNFRVNFNNSCTCGTDTTTAMVTVEAPIRDDGTPYTVDDYAYDGGDRDRWYNQRVELSGVGNMTIDAQTYVHINEVKDQEFFVKFNDRKLRLNGTGANNYFDTDIRWNHWYDEEQSRFQTVPTIQVDADESRDQGNGPVKITSHDGENANYKLRVCGYVDVSGIKMPTSANIRADASRIEMANQRWRSDITLGSNSILICDDCSGEYNITTTTGTVLVPNQNDRVRLTVNGVYLGTPHIFGDYNGFGIFFPVSSNDNISFTVEQGCWNDATQCVDGWAKLTSFEVQYKQDGGCNLGQQEGKDWISYPDQVRVTAKVKGAAAGGAVVGGIAAGGTATSAQYYANVIYDPIMWKPIQVGEFVELLNGELNENYDPSDINGGLNENSDLTYGTAKAILTAVWDVFKAGDPDLGKIDLHAVIPDEGYWDLLESWEVDTDPNKNDWNPDNWTRSWDDARDMLSNLKRKLGIQEEPEEQVINTDVILTLRRHPSDDEEYPWRDTVIVDTDDSETKDLKGNRIENCRFTGNVTITCDPNYKDGDNFAGRVFLQNCTFEQGVKVQPVNGVTFCVDFTNSCTCGAENASAVVNVPGLSSYSYNENSGNYENAVELCGVGNMNINAATYVRINEVKNQRFELTFNGGTFHFDGTDANNEYSVDVRWDRWKENGDTDFRSEPCVQLNAESDGVGAVKVFANGGNYTGKLRVAGFVDVSGVSLGTNGRIELAAHYNQENPEWSDCQNSQIELGGNEIIIGGDCSGDHSFTGTGTVLVFDRNDKVNLTVNGKRLGAPHIFGSGDYGIYLGLTDISDVGFAVKEGETTLDGTARLYNEVGPVGGANTAPATKCHIEKAGDNWITDVPNNIRLEVTVGGCTAIYDPLHVKGE